MFAPSYAPYILAHQRDAHPLAIAMSPPYPGLARPKWKGRAGARRGVEETSDKNDAPHAVAQREVPKPTPSPNNAPQLQRRNRVRPARAQDAPLDTPVSAVRTALKRRLASEPSVEPPDRHPLPPSL
ncbi:hypothetical protein B0H17DRAFT_1192243 [Mycena rosella]|uniref:Uncharacterized protein n=1 Tax=Mycena rosella TaxID=1033263 RepID=A0AAD7GYG1_MYCRO|nr:hypothetical protein B0H17DRAFT_1192243 [Mycena rosella]